MSSMALSYDAVVMMLIGYALEHRTYQVGYGNRNELNPGQAWLTSVIISKNT